MIDATLSAQIERFGQQHVLQHWDELTDAGRVKLVEQLQQVDWSLIGEYQSTLRMAPDEMATAIGSITPPAHVVRQPRTANDRQVWEDADRKGKEVLQQGTAGVILLAGGQGTRLGFPHPKGMFPIGPVSKKSLFELFAEQIIGLSDRFGHSIPYLIMTSDGTHDETVEFFFQNDHFGLDQRNVFFFQQGYAPSLDLPTGRLLRAEKDSICLSPDGHGGLLNALLKANLFEKLRSRQIEYLFLHQVDNPLVKICEPAFLGLHIGHEAQVSIKVVAKTDPDEKVGLAVDVDGRTQIIEYSDLPTALAHERNPNGELKYWAGSTAIHVFNRSFLESIATSHNSLPWHRAKKKIPYMGDQGKQVHPETENGVKFERFLFDTLPMAKTALVVETNRDEEFAPLKNQSGAFSAEYVQQQMNQATTASLRKLGFRIPEGAIIEVSPRFAFFPEELTRRSNQLANVRPGDSVYIGPDA